MKKLQFSQPQIVKYGGIKNVTHGGSRGFLREIGFKYTRWHFE
ncbi:hypothetical protein [Caldalkalibacillus mannanilyticus]|nr:hypothetical protein [Caldalkalibacillus mannanilyticus]